MKLRIFSEYYEIEVEHQPMPESRFRALCRIFFMVVAVAGELAALWLVGKIALVGLLPIGLAVLFAAANDA